MAGVAVGTPGSGAMVTGAGSGSGTTTSSSSSPGGGMSTFMVLSFLFFLDFFFGEMVGGDVVSAAVVDFFFGFLAGGLLQGHWAQRAQRLRLFFLGACPSLRAAAAARLTLLSGTHLRAGEQSMPPNIPIGRPGLELVKSIVAVHLN